MVARGAEFSRYSLSAFLCISPDVVQRFSWDGIVVASSQRRGFGGLPPESSGAKQLLAPPSLDPRIVLPPPLPVRYRESHPLENRRPSDSAPVPRRRPNQMIPLRGHEPERRLRPTIE